MDYDFFVSHASEDKEQIAQPLAKALRAYDFAVFLDVWEILPGDNLLRKLDEGIRGSRCGLVIVSERFAVKHHTVQELDALLTLEQDGTRIVPVFTQCGSCLVSASVPHSGP